MNNPDFHKDRPSLQLPGKEFMIVVVVIFSALSFTLGYFVGKIGIDGKSVAPSQAVEMATIPQNQETAVINQPAALAQPQSASIAENKNTPQAEEAANGPVVFVETKKPEPVKAALPAKEKPPLHPVGQNVAQSATQELPKGTLKEPLKKPETKDSSITEDSGKLNGSLYTVQMAAFKSASEARSFSKKHKKNGVKTYITTSTGKNKVKIYKVRSGEFKDKKDAEVMSLKLNKSRNLKTFVTLKNE
jgi:cell division septation protein DedD